MNITFSAGAAANSLQYPESCAEVKTNNPSATDGEYQLYVAQNPDKPWNAWCHNLADSPVEYLTLPSQGSGKNYSQYTRGGGVKGKSVRTTYTRVLIDPTSLKVDIGDQTFASSTGLLNKGRKDVVRSMPFGVATDCIAAQSKAGTANIDLQGTPFKMVHGDFVVGGYRADGRATFSSNDQVVSLSGGGYCGWIAPGNVYGPVNNKSGALQLVYGESNPSFSVPNLIGLTPNAATNTLLANSFRAPNVVEVLTEGRAVNRVKSQNPTGGTRVKSSDMTVTITVATPGAMLPEVIGLQEAQARRTLADAGFSAQVTYCDCPGSTAGAVTQVSGAGLLPKGQVIALEVKNLAPPPAVRQPNSQVDLAETGATSSSNSNECEDEGNLVYLFCRNSTGSGPRIKDIDTDRFLHSQMQNALKIDADSSAAYWIKYLRPENQPGHCPQIRLSDAQNYCLQGYEVGSKHMCKVVTQNSFKQGYNEALNRQQSKIPVDRNHCLELQPWHEYGRQYRGGYLTGAEKVYMQDFRAEGGVIHWPNTGLAAKPLKQGLGNKPSYNTTVSLVMRYATLDSAVDRIRRNEGSTNNFNVELKPYCKSCAEGVNITVLKPESTFPGLSQALQDMSVGSRWKLVLEPHLAFGKTGNQELGILNNTMVVIDVELVGFGDLTQKITQEQRQYTRSNGQAADGYPSEAQGNTDPEGTWKWVATSQTVSPGLVEFVHVPNGIERGENGSVDLWLKTDQPGQYKFDSPNGKLLIVENNEIRFEPPMQNQGFLIRNQAPQWRPGILNNMKPDDEVVASDLSMRFSWAPSPGASEVLIEFEVFDEGGNWVAELVRSTQVERSPKNKRRYSGGYNESFRSTRTRRWRAWNVMANGTQGPKTPWRVIKFTGSNPGPASGPSEPSLTARRHAVMPPTLIHSGCYRAVDESKESMVESAWIEPMIIVNPDFQLRGDNLQDPTDNWRVADIDGRKFGIRYGFSFDRLRSIVMSDMVMGFPTRHLVYNPAGYYEELSVEDVCQKEEDADELLRAAKDKVSTLGLMTKVYQGCHVIPGRKEPLKAVQDFPFLYFENYAPADREYIERTRTYPVDGDKDYCKKW